VKTGTLQVPGASLSYGVRGSGPVLLMIPGGPMDAGGFTGIAERLADPSSYALVGHCHDRNRSFDLSPSLAALVRTQSQPR
jgi:pimeloyl-ACP methyl ester carboxylesterase